MKLLKAIPFLFAALLSASCGEKEPAEREPVLKVSPESATVDAEGGFVVFTVYSSQDWVVSSGASWAKPMQSSGKASGQGTSFTVNVSMNEDTSNSRTAKITVKDLDLNSVIVTLTQDALDPTRKRREVKGIANGQDLLDFAQLYNSGKPVTDFAVDGVFKLLNDIDCSQIGDWPGIGTQSIPFTGTFDGGGHHMTGVKFHTAVNGDGCAGLFGVVKNAVVNNLVFGAEGDSYTVEGAPGEGAFYGAVVGYGNKLAMSAVTNNVSISAAGGNCGGLCGYLDGSIEKCVNKGNVLLSGKGRASGFAAYCIGTVSQCTNRGCIIAPEGGQDQMGPAWGCSYCKLENGFTGNTGYGHVGGTAFLSDPSKAPADNFLNAVLGPSKTPFDIETTTVDRTADSYYDWKVMETGSLHSGVTYTKYRFTGVPRTAYVLEVDLSDPSVEITTSFADDIVPNPNANSNSNNGFKVRETLSMLCQRKRSSGMDILAGVNSGFFDSNDGIARGPHIENGEPVYINNPSVRKALPNHDWAFTVFTDGTASCGKKTFNGSSYGRAGTFEIGGRSFDYCSVNDTIVRHVNASFQANMYTSRYVKQPHPEELPKVTNSLARDAYYLVCRYTEGPMHVNTGAVPAVVTAIANGTSVPLEEGPYVSGKDEFVLALSGSVAQSVSSLAKVGTTLSIRCDIAVDGESKPILTQNSSMFRFLQDGRDESQSISSTHSNITTYDPITFVTVDKSATKVWIIEVDGRKDWVELGVKSYEMYRICLKMGGWNMTRLDGGGSSCMWIYDRSAGRGSIVNSVCDSKGERSCMNYLLIRTK